MLIKNYYYERVYMDGMPEFDNISDGEKKVIEQSYGYALWNLNKKFEELKDQIKAQLHLN